MIHAAAPHSVGCQALRHNGSIVLNPDKYTSNCQPPVVYGVERPENKITVDQSVKCEIALKRLKERNGCLKQVFFSLYLLKLSLQYKGLVEHWNGTSTERKLKKIFVYSHRHHSLRGTTTKTTTLSIMPALKHNPQRCTLVCDNCSGLSRHRIVLTLIWAH